MAKLEKKKGKQWPVVRTDNLEGLGQIVESFHNSRIARPNEAGKRKTELTKEMWESSVNALRYAAKGVPLDPEIAGWLAFVVGEIAVGKTPEELEDIKTKGKPADTYVQAGYKDTAALYYQAVEAKDVADKSPVKTLSDQFGCSKQTIRVWVKNAPKGLWKKFWPSAPTEVRTKYLKMKIKYDALSILMTSGTEKAIRSRAQAK